MPHCNAVDADAPFWRDAQETKLSDIAVLTLNPTAQLVHAALFGAHARGTTPMSRARDVMLLLNARANEIEWKIFTRRSPRIAWFCRYAKRLNRWHLRGTNAVSFQPARWETLRRTFLTKT